MKAVKALRFPRIRSVLIALALVIAPGAAVIGTAGEASAATKISHATATSMFREAGITWSSSGNCSNRNTPTCTSFEQLNLAGAQGAQTLKRASGCALNITGGTETGHAFGTYSHWNGYKLDYSKYTCLGNYIKNNFASIGVRGDGAGQWRSGSGNIYAEEGNHWDVTYYNCGGC
ncbi:hypothetical protein OH738_39835 [Streptomyces hirsutus]|uniref:Peptidoglycan-binding protein n=1 Tax=Streptomyces hirsutus TaxID=35620 RepID=A0ABZ1GFX9_9ACTN|nr:hypothetical protein [Streptomyces hirsutus]WTD72657.1 hypothetical protein OHB56_00665 [Streptomyces sp. NBC_01635]WSD04338.1 hypothetical protein OIE73_00120 [Streptomyces hirsutus]WSD11165.1 hypothetical protein OIE73_39605 [Streptomyces hirsutus]WTD15481.1 hypothetical protein OH738_00345 [Streptomyces hirsutus]WTD22274.1 hypothetical protein OH738_39835 [Streptomyces hirsutus]